MKKICFFCFVRKVGDTIISTGFIHALKQAYPDISVDVCMQGQYTALLAGNKDIRKVYPFTMKRLSLLKLCFLLRMQRYDVLINQRSFEMTSLKQKFFLKLIGARRMEYMFYSNGCHISEDYLGILKKLDVNIKEYPDYLLHIPETVWKQAEDFFTVNIKPDIKTVAFNPFGAEAPRTITMENIEKIISLMKSLNLQVILLDYPKKCNHLVKDVVLLQTHDILLTAAVLSKADFVLSVDTGIVHLADIFKKKIIDLFSGFNQSGVKLTPEFIEKWGPRKRNGHRCICLQGKITVNDISLKDIGNAIVDLLDIK